MRCRCWDSLIIVTSQSSVSLCLRLDYCNSLYAHCNVSTRQRLQRVQNRAARLILNTPPRAPSDLCEQCSNTRLRSASRGDYILPRSRLRCVDSSFSISASTTWNNLPAHIRSCTSLRSFYLNSIVSPFHHLFPSLVISSHIVHIPCSGLSLFFPFYFYFYLVCSFLILSLFDVIMFGAPRPQSFGGDWWGWRLSKSMDLIWFEVSKVLPCNILTITCEHNNIGQCLFFCIFICQYGICLGLPVHMKTGLGIL